MKFIVSLSSLALISLSSVSPCLAANQVISRSAEPSLSSHSLPSAAKTIQVAGLFDSVNKVLNTVEREKTRAEQRADRERARRTRQERMEAAQKQRAERAAAMAAKREQERKYFESLTPEQQKQYIAQQRARQEQQARQMLLMLGVFGAAMGGNSTASPQQTQEYYHIENTSTPSYNSAPPTKYESGFYGNCHSYDCK
jgi:flagellar biosynthesis GTPase FlhF